MSNDSEKEPIFAAPTPAYGGESAPLYQERTKTKQMVNLPQSLLCLDHKRARVYYKCPYYCQRSMSGAYIVLNIMSKVIWGQVHK
jgi:hypothetical protein